MKYRINSYIERISKHPFERVGLGLIAISLALILFSWTVSWYLFQQPISGSQIEAKTDTSLGQLLWTVRINKSLRKK